MKTKITENEKSYLDNGVSAVKSAIKIIRNGQPILAAFILGGNIAICRAMIKNPDTSFDCMEKAEKLQEINFKVADKILPIDPRKFF